MALHGISNSAFSSLGIISNMKPPNMHIASNLQKRSICYWHSCVHTSITTNF